MDYFRRLFMMRVMSILIRSPPAVDDEALRSPTFTSRHEDEFRAYPRLSLQNRHNIQAWLTCRIVLGTCSYRARAQWLVPSPLVPAREPRARYVPVRAHA